MIGINSVIYEEPDWKRTKRDILACDVPTVFVDRGGVGSLAKAYNQGFYTLIDAYPDLKYVWFVSNVTFTYRLVMQLVTAMERSGYDAIHPCFTSDHLFCRCKGNGLREVPFVEFTAPIVRVDTYKQIPLDEDMPYWGHDFDWGWKVRQAGGHIGVLDGVTLGHEYIRFRAKSKPHPKTLKRRQLRLDTNAQTEEKLVRLYGEDYRKKLGVDGFK